MPLGGILRKHRNSVSMAAMNLSQVIFGHTLDIVFSSKQLVYDLKLEDISMNLLRWLDPFRVHLLGSLSPTPAG